MEPTSFQLPRAGAPGAIPCHGWAPAGDGPPRLGAVLVHGLGDHGLALPYRLLAAALVAAGWRVWSYDQRGHGRAGDHPPARLPGLEADLRQLLGLARASLPGGVPVVAVGLSMGALVALRACAAHPGAASGVVAASAPLGPVTAHPAAVLAATLLGRWLPGLPLQAGLDIGAVTDHPGHLARYTADPLFSTRTRMGLAADLLAAVKGLRAQAAALPLPALFLHGRQDRIAPWDEGLAAALAGPGRVLHLLDHGHHNLFLDQGRQAAFDAIAAWGAGLAAAAAPTGA